MRFEVFAAMDRESFDSEDLAFGWKLLGDVLPGRWHVTLGGSLAALVSRAHAALGPFSLPCLLVRDARLVISRAGIDRLVRGYAATGADAVIAAEPGLGRTEPIDYLTLAGLERFGNRADRVAPYQYTSGNPTVVLARPEGVTALFAGEQWRLPQNSWVIPGAHVHPYPGYYDAERAELVEHLPERIHRMLDVGGGAGYFAAAAKRARNCTVEVAELNASLARAATRRVDRVWEGNFLTAGIAPGFDCITALDVVEHVASPAEILNRIHQLLVPGGTFVASVPNVGHWSVVADLLAGRWDYVPGGITCWTHLRFFTRRTLEDFWQRASFVIERISPIVVPAPPGLKEHLVDSARHCGTVTADLETFQFIVVARRR
jgi:SAM-dependent methyltransferase